MKKTWLLVACGILAVFAGCVAVDARALSTRHQALQVSNVTAITVDSTWQAAQATGGIKDFLITLHGRFMYEKEQASEFQGIIEKQTNRSAEKIQGQLKDVMQIVNNLNFSLSEQYHEIEGIGRVVQDIRERQAPIQRHLHQLWGVFNTTQVNWEVKLKDIERQRNTALNSLQNVEEIIDRMKGPNPDSDVYTKLLKLQQATQTKKLNSIIQTAITAAPSASSDGTLELLHAILGNLRKNLLAHTEELWEDVIMANNSRRAHSAKMMSHINGLQAQVDSLEDKVRVEEKPLKDINEYIEELHDKLRPHLAQMTALHEQLDALMHKSKHEMEALDRQEKSRQARIQNLEAMRQFIKARLVDGNEATKAILGSLTNPLRPKGNFSHEWDQMKKSDRAGWAPSDLKATLCGSWKFSEAKDDPYTVDSSPYGNDGKLHGVYIRRIRSGPGNAGAMVFDGINDFVDLGTVGAFGAHLNNFTAELWVKTTDTHPVAASIMKVIERGPNMVFGIDVNRRVGARREDGSYPVGQQPTTKLDVETGMTLVYLRDARGRILAGHVNANYFDGRWHHLQWSVVNAAHNTMHFFMDGKELPFIATIEQGPSYFRNFTDNLYIGAADVRGEPMSFFDGAVSDVQLWCQSTSAPSDRVCCQICKENEQACGDDCISSGRLCHQRSGCSCNAGDNGILLHQKPIFA